MKMCNFRNILENGDYLNISKKNFWKRKQEWVSQLRTGKSELIYSAESGGRLKETQRLTFTFIFPSTFLISLKKLINSKGLICILTR